MIRNVGLIGAYGFLAYLFLNSSYCALHGIESHSCTFESILSNSILCFLTGTSNDRFVSYRKSMINFTKCYVDLAMIGRFLTHFFLLLRYCMDKVIFDGSLADWLSWYRMPTKEW